MPAQERKARAKGSPLWRWLRELALLGAALFLVGDAGTLALMPPTPRRVLGCYTVVELVVGVSAPSIIRPTELLLGVGLLLLALWKALRAAWTALWGGRACPKPGMG
jgi:hypothetical protein